MSQPLWKPEKARADQTTLASFSTWMSSRTGKPLSSYEELHRYSVADPGEFWSALWDFAGVVGEKGSPPFLVDESRMPGARFFPGARLNFAENLLRKDGAGTALVFWGEDKVKRRMSWSELNAEVARMAAALREAGVGDGDRIGAILPNMPEAIVSVLAVASIGAVWSSCSPDFGAQGVLDRLSQIEPKVLIACDGYYYGGKTIDIADKLTQIVAKLPTVGSVIVVPYLGRDAAVVQGLNAGMSHTGRRAQTWGEAVGSRTPGELSFTRLPFAHPLYVLFSSGTTGMPKCIVHSAGGTLMKHLCEHRMHSDVRDGDRLFYFTTLSWMMWNWLVSGLAQGATLLLYDGSPFHPDGNILWDYAQSETCTHFGTSAKYIDALKKAELTPAESHDLSSVRAMLSTGSPLVPEAFDYVYAAIKQDLHLASISGGTDIVGCFVLGIPTKPVWRGEIQGPGLGLAVEVVDETGRPVGGGQGRARVPEAVSLDADRLLERSRRQEVQRRLLPALRERLASRRLRRVDRARRHRHPRPLRRHAQPRRGAYRHGRDLPPGRAAARGAGERRHRPGLGQRCPRRAVRGPEAGREPRRCPARAHQEADPLRRQPAPRAGKDHPGRRHPAQQVRQGLRARRARRRARPRHQELGRTGQPGGSGHLSQHG